MGTKRSLTISVVVALVLGLVVILLFQSGADQKLVESVLPRIEKRFDIRVRFKHIDTSLTSVTLRGVEIRSRQSRCLFASSEKVTLGMRVGPLFMGKFDLTGLRIDGLEAKVGKLAKGCEIEEWKTLSSSDSPSKLIKTRMRRRPEIHIVSGKLAYKDEQFTLNVRNISGRIGDELKAVVDVGGFDVRNKSGALFIGNESTLKYAPDTKHVSVTVDHPTLEIPASKTHILALFRDLQASWKTVNGTIKDQQVADTKTDESTKDKWQLPVLVEGGIQLAVKDGSCSFVDTANPHQSAPIQNLELEATIGKDRPLIVQTAGQLPGTDARFGLAFEIPNEGAPYLTLKVPDLSLSTVGPMVFSSSHVDWSQASLDGDLKASFENQGASISLAGQVSLSNLTLEHPRIVQSIVSGLSLSSDFKLVYDVEQHLLHLERLQVSKDLARLTARGEFYLDRLAFDLFINMPNSKCQHLKSAVANLFPTRLAKTRFEGQISLDAHISVDESKPEEVILETALDNRCRIADFGDLPESNYFRGPFSYSAYDENQEPLRLITGPGTDRWTSLGNISSYLVEAVTVTEDGKFWKHSGITIPEMKRAIELNLKKGALKHGASTITMQLAKNLFLGRERTLARKLQEIVFVWYLESYFSKEDILELYFNIVEFGPSLYGIKDASLYYFGREPNDLNLLESVFLIKLLPNPVNRHQMYERGKLSQRQMAMLHRVLQVMFERGRISEQELALAKSQSLAFHKEGSPLPEPREQAERNGSRSYVHSEVSEEIEEAASDIEAETAL